MKENEFTDQKYLTEQQYKDASNLNARLNLHKNFSINKQELQHWVFAQLDLPDQARILDVGCGPGDLWMMNAKDIPEGWQIIMADLSPGMLQKAKENLAAINQIIEYREVDAQVIPYGDDSFDAVIAGHMLYHVPDIPKALSEIRRVLKPGGRLYATTNGSGHLKELHQLLTQIDPEYGFSNAARFFGLENGEEILAPFFDNVEVVRFEDGLMITEVQPLLDYIASMNDDWLGERMDTAASIISKVIETEGAYRISKEPGMVVGRKQQT